MPKDMEKRRLIRVLYIIATLDPAGAERQMAHLARRLDRNEFEPAVCALTRGGPLEEDLSRSGIPVRILHKRGRWDLGVIGRLRQVIREFGPQIIHTWLPTANTLGRIAGLLEKTPVLIASERAKDAWKGPLRRAADRFLTARSHRILTNSLAVKSFLAERIGIPPEKIRVIPNGLDLAEFDAKTAEPVEAPSPTGDVMELGTVARLEPQKGLPYLLDAVSMLPKDLEVRLWIVGGGPVEASLRDQAKRLGIADAVQFLGTRQDVPALMARFDLFVLPSLWEGLPNVVLEAMAARRAVVATNVDGTPEAVLEGETALLVPPRDPGALADAMTRLLRDREMRRRFGEAGRRRVESEFRMEIMVERTQDEYRRALENAK
jgi:starch synthase (maltosyl-transferring)